MKNTKIVKAKCAKNGLYFAMELAQFGSTWKAINMIPLTNEEYRMLGSEIKQREYFTNSNLLDCSVCGSRKVGGCNCLSKKISCSSSMPYQFECIYCTNFKIDYTGPRQKSPYNSVKGISNIPNAIKDSYGNPIGSQYDLAMDDGFIGYKIVVLNLCDECNFDAPRKALQKKGFEVVEYKTAPSVQQLEKELFGDETQLWIISHKTSFLNDNHINLICSYFNRGNGIYIWGDNDPYYVDANKITQKLFNTKMSGNYIGKNVLGIRHGYSKSGIIENHPITTGLVNFFEGITIAHIHMNSNLEELMYSSDGNVLAAFYDKDGKRALVDGGFTRLWCNWDSAGTDRYIVNAAAWLANIERFGYMQ